ncbi:MAG: hypothetical protein HY887_06295 [Deltaproteobacteria bacterium]|nr:hypothetical protein [Deltaproteobacteria bacterium]
MKGTWVPSNTPVLCPGSGKTWDGLSVITPDIFSKGAGREYGMFYVGLSSRSDAWGIGYAESDDLSVWEKHGLNPLIRREDESNSFSYDSPCLIKKNATFHLFLEEKKFRKDMRKKIKYALPMGIRRPLGRLRRLLKGKEGIPLSVQHAEGRRFVSFSSDKLLDWEMDSRRLVLEKGVSGGFDGSGLFSPQVHEFEGRYYMFYGGSDGDVTSTGFAVSDDLLKWERGALSPVLRPGAKGQWDEYNALIVSILKAEDGYCGFYEGEDVENTYRIGLAYSCDLKRWEKFEGNPIIETGGRGAFNEKMACSPHIFSDKGRTLLFYTGHDRSMRGCCGAAELKAGFNG